MSGEQVVQALRGGHLAVVKVVEDVVQAVRQRDESRHVVGVELCHRRRVDGQYPREDNRRRVAGPTQYQLVDQIDRREGPCIDVTVTIWKPGDRERVVCKHSHRGRVFTTCALAALGGPDETWQARAVTDFEQFAAQLDRVESELAIRRLAYEYCHGADKRDRARWAAVWAHDGVWAVSPDQEFVGVEAICAAVAGQWDAFRQMHHFTANHVVWLDGDDATGEADVALSVELVDGAWIRGGAVYRDRYVRRHGVWRIARREAGSDFYYDPLPPGVGPRTITSEST